MRSPGGFIGWGDTNSWRNCFYMLHRGVYRSHIRAHLKMPFCIGCGHPYLKIVYPLALVGRKNIQLKCGHFTLLLLSFRIMHSCLIAIGLFSKAVESVFTEPKFSSAGLASTPNGALVLESARSLKEWMENSSNKSLLVHFSKMLLLRLRTCFVQDKHHCLKKDQMWGLYHQMHTSEKFRKAWSDFLFYFILLPSCNRFYF